MRFRNKRTLIAALVSLVFTALPTLSSWSAPQQNSFPTVAPKVLVITMFGEEAKPWLEGEKFTTKLKIPGLNPEYPEIACTDSGLCLATTAMGFANAASSTAAIALSPDLDLRETYFLIAGIAGVDPEQGTLGSAHWAKYAVDIGLNHRIDQRELPENWTTNFFGLGTEKIGDKPKWGAGTEVFALNPKLAEFALSVTKNVSLADADTAKEYRKKYSEKAASGEPAVSICDTASGDTYWHGTKTAEAVAEWLKMQTDGKADYCTSQMEDNATLAALKRGAEAGRLNFDRIAVLRTASNFDRQGKDQTASESLAAKSGGFPLATTNAYRVGKTFADAIIRNWAAWKVEPVYAVK